MYELTGYIVLVSHCLLNRYSAVYGTSRSPKTSISIISVLTDFDVGVIQLECPEFTYLGPNRFWMVKDQYDNAYYRLHCRDIACSAVEQVKEYLRNGFKLIGVLCVKGSPSCGYYSVKRGDWKGNPLEAGTATRSNEMGVFIEELNDCFKGEGIDARFFEYDPKNPAGEGDRLRRWVEEVI